MLNMQNLLRAKYAHIFKLHVERDRGLRWGATEPTPLLLSEDFFFGLGLVKAYLINTSKTLTGDAKVIEHLEDFLYNVVSAINDYSGVLDWEIPNTMYQGTIKINAKTEEFEATFEYQSNHFYINLNKVDTQNIHLFMGNLI